MEVGTFHSKELDISSIQLLVKFRYTHNDAFLYESSYTH